VNQTQLKQQHRRQGDDHRNKQLPGRRSRPATRPLLSKSIVLKNMGRGSITMALAWTNQASFICPSRQVAAIAPWSQQATDAPTTFVNSLDEPMHLWLPDSILRSYCLGLGERDRAPISIAVIFTRLHFYLLQRP